MPSEPIPIVQVAQAMGLSADDLELHGKYKAKIPLELLDRYRDRPDGKYIVVTTLTPTPTGEGKTTTAIGLAMAMNRIGYRAAVCLRQSSLGSVLNYNGGAAGSGAARIEPFDEANLHLTGDHHAVALAHNLLASLIDNHLFHGNSLDLDPFSVSWPRAVEMHDRALRGVLTGLGGRKNGTPREGRFDAVTVSEVMSLLALVNGLSAAEARRDLRARVGRIVIGRTRRGKFVTAQDLRAAGAMAALLQDALKPNLLQTSEHSPAFIHTSPLAHLAHGSNSILADRMALKLNDYVITETGFGADLGLEKFVNIKCRVSGLRPDVIVIVATLRALRMHGGAAKVVAGKPLPEELSKENLLAVERGAANLVRHIEIARLFGVPVLVAINRYPSDTDRELARLETLVSEAGAEGFYASDAYVRGGAGAVSLAEAVVHAAQKPTRFQMLYSDGLGLKDKIERIVTQVYGGAGVEYSSTAEEKLCLLTEEGFGTLPVCMAKTHLSLTNEDKIKGRPKGFKISVRDVRLATGAGYVIALCGDLRTLPGLSAHPAATTIDVDDYGRVLGLG